MDGAVLHLIITLLLVNLAAIIDKILLWNEIIKILLVIKNFNKVKKQKKYFKYLLFVLILNFGVITLIFLSKEYNFFLKD